MEFSVIAAIITVLFWLVQAVISFREKTFSCRQGRVKMSFLQNWAVSIGDLFIFPIINGLIIGNTDGVGHFKLKYLIFLILGAIVSYILHQLWWRRNENLGHVFPSWENSRKYPQLWTSDISAAGWVHFFFVAFQSAVLVLYISSLLPLKVVIWVGALFVAFLVIQNLQAKFIQGNFSFLRALCEFIITILVVMVKL
ncbi:hypothetical protein KKD72_02960 [Patescibacteria group bacterium]|nr:hypothetical protein [Patescibacteria group bacterium]